MAAFAPQPELSPSLIDRLIDMNPGSQRDPAVNQWQQGRDVQSSLARDLTALLNTRRAAADFDENYEESTNSLLTFGIVDFTSYNLKKGAGQEQLRRSIESAIRRFEPRLERVTVSMDEADQLRPILRFQVTAVLRTESQEPVVFEATLHRDSRRVAVSGGA
jgi:type VI secretion system protein ImpF